MTPAASACNPRCAIGLAMSRSRFIAALPSGDLEHPVDFHRRIERQYRDTDSGADVAALVAKCHDHEVGGAVHDLRSLHEIRGAVDEAAEPDHARDLVEIAERRLDLRQEVNGAGSRAFLAFLDRNIRAQLAGGDEFTLG